MPKRAVQTGEDRRADLITYICEEVGGEWADREKVARDLDGFAWSLVWSIGGPKLKEYYNSRYGSGKEHFKSVVCAISKCAIDGWAPRSAVVKELTRKDGAGMHSYQVGRVLQDLESIGFLKRRESGGRVSYCFSRPPRNDPEHERLVKVYAQLEIAQDLAREYGQMLGIRADEVQAEMDRRLEARCPGRFTKQK